MFQPNKIHFTLVIGVMIITIASIVSAHASNSGGGSSAPRLDRNTSKVDIAEIYRQGIAEYSAGDFKAAERSMKKVTAVARTDANSHYLLGLSQMGLESWRSASNSLKKAVRYDEELYDARAELGIAYIKREKLKDAMKQLDALQSQMNACADDCSSKLEKAFEKLSSVMSPVDGESISYIPQEIDFSIATGEFVYLDAVRLVNLGQYQAAIEQLKTAHRVYGPHPDVLTYLGFAHRMNGQSARALEFYQAALTVAPDHLNATEYLGEYYVEQGNMVAAKLQLDKLENLCNFGCAQLDELKAWMLQAESVIES